MRDFESIIYKAKFIANDILKNPEHAEDIAQDVALKILEHPESRQPLKFAVIDAIRSRFGRTRLPDGSYRPSQQSLEVSLDAEVNEGSRVLRHELIGDTKTYSEPERYDPPSPISAQDDRRAIMLKAYRAGLNLKAVANAFDVTESRVSQILSEAPERLADRLERKLKLAEKAERCAGTINVKWWVL